MELRRVRALSARTHFVPGYGQVHFDPDSPKEGTRHPLVPASAVEALVGKGWVADDLPVEVDAPAKPKGGRRAVSPPAGAASTEAGETAAPPTDAAP